MKRRFPTFVYVIAFLLGVEFMVQGLMPFLGFTPLTPARMVLTIQYFTSGILIFAITYCLFKKGDKK